MSDCGICGRLNEKNSSDVVRRFFVGASANDVAAELSKLRGDGKEILTIFADVGLTIWDHMMNRLERFVAELNSANMPMHVSLHSNDFWRTASITNDVAA
jgi:hypothetical protein